MRCASTPSMCRRFGNVGELLCRARRVPCPAAGMKTVLHCKAAGRIPPSWTPCGKDMAITASSPSSAGTGHISVGLWVLVNIIGRWCVKPAVLVGTLKATSQTKLKDYRPCQLLLNCMQEWHTGGALSIQLITKRT